MLGARHTDRNREAKLCPYAPPYLNCNFGRGSEEMGASRDVGERLVDRDSLDKRRKVVKYVYDGIAQSLIIFKMSANKDQVRTKLSRPPS